MRVEVFAFDDPERCERQGNLWATGEINGAADAVRGNLVERGQNC